MLIGILSVQFGAGVAKSLFDEVAPTLIVWLRLVTSAVVLVLLARPALRRRTSRDWLVVAGFGASLGVMNWAIYQSFARIPLGIAVTVEFVGPLALAVLGSRRPRDLLWVLLAAVGVGLLGLERGHVTLAGVLFALLAGAAWATYILLSAQTGRRWPGLDGLAVASVVATLLLTPVALHVGRLGPGRRAHRAAGRGGGAAQLGDPLQLRAGRAALAAAGGLQHPDEPGAGCRGARRHRGARRVPRAGAVGRDGVRRRGERRRHPRAAAARSPSRCRTEFTQPSHDVDARDASGS